MSGNIVVAGHNSQSDTQSCTEMPIIQAVHSKMKTIQNVLHMHKRLQ